MQQAVSAPNPENAITEFNKTDDVDHGEEPKYIMLKDIAQPSLWTRPAVHEFINQLKDDTGIVHIIAILYQKYLIS